MIGQGNCQLPTGEYQKYEEKRRLLPKRPNRHLQDSPELQALQARTLPSASQMRLHQLKAVPLWIICCVCHPGEAALCVDEKI